jgi:hypothetical protein
MLLATWNCVKDDNRKVEASALANVSKNQLLEREAQVLLNQANTQRSRMWS